MKNAQTTYTPYYRVSTKGQGRSGLGLEAQKSDVLSYVGKDESKLHGEFVEVEKGGMNNRAKLNEALNFCRTHGTTLLIAKLDRLSRDVGFIFQLKNGDVPFECCDIPEANTLTIGIFATIAQHERELISARTKASLRAYKDRGGKLGSPQNLTDESRKKATISIKENARNNPNNRRAVGYIKELRDNEHTYQSIAHRLNREGFLTARRRQFTATAVRRLYMKAVNFA